MPKKMKTINLQGKEYAQVKDRVKQFREECPNGKIETTPMIQENGTMIFKAYIVKDKSKPESPDATGHSYGDKKDAKAFEKLETIAVGRALALLGYAQDGDIASSEEMEEFNEYQEEKKTKEIEEAEKKLKACTSLDKLKKVWSSLPAETKEALGALKDKLKEGYDKTTV